MSPANIRLGYVALLAIAVLAQVGFTIGRPSRGQTTSPRAESVSYPPVVPLPGWQLRSSQGKKSPHALMEDGYVYFYTNNGETLTVQAHLEINKSGAVNHYLMLNGIPISPNTLDIRNSPEQGTYGIVMHSDKTYLSACLNAAGKSTFDQAELTANRYQYGISPLGIVGWLLGFNNLTDNRCLLTIMAMPVPIPNPLTYDNNVKRLEAAWADWYDWWKDQWQTLAFK
ncbi:MAG: hypothetical protein RLZZ568_1685 [Cyanobacteriota bacterium]